MYLISEVKETTLGFFMWVDMKKHIGLKFSVGVNQMIEKIVENFGELIRSIVPNIISNTSVVIVKIMGNGVGRK